MLLLVTDLDDTLLSEQPSTISEDYLKKFQSIWKTVLKPQHSLLTYNTGRSFFLSCQLVEERNLEWPDYLICGLGTEIYEKYECKSLRKIEGWTILKDFNSKVICECADEWLHSGVLALQPVTENTVAKMSFDFKSEQLEYVNNVVAPNICRVAEERGSICHVVISISQGIGHLDFVPAQANKGTATKWLKEYVGVASNQVMVCGNSMNDYDMFFGSCDNVLRVAVENCDINIRQKFIEHSQSDSRFYIASKPFAGGILEGLVHFNLLNQ